MSADARIRDEAARWFARHRDAADADSAAFARWRDADPRHAAAYDDVAQTWAGVEAFAADDAVRRATREAFEARVLPRRTLALRYAAIGGAVAAALLLFVAGRDLLPRDASGPIATEVGEQRQLVLADGSHLTLDTDSVIAVTLTPAERRIDLKRGQVHFEVAHDAARPFVVHAGGGSVTALGTVFDVRVQDDARVIVTLLEGQVAVRQADAVRTPVLLQPRQQLRFDRAVIEPIRSIEPIRVAAWREGKLVFDAQPLPDVVAEINRYAKRKLRIADPSLRTIRISGVFAIDHIDSTLLQQLTSVFPIAARPVRDEILLVPR